MFKVDREDNSVSPLTPRRFSELSFREREHVQIWIEKHPELLGEELLIIQKEFDGWSETSERLDLLALDKNGHIVVIENKLDDSGRDTVWQAMKYAAYCSTLNTQQILSIYGKYLRSEGGEEEAEARIVDFLDKGSIEELVLNPSNQQRMILTARSFRTEVTATCLWLIGNNIGIRCVELRPYQDGDAIYISAEQVIPPPKSEEFMVSFGAKEKSEASQSAAASEWMLTRQEFFEALLTKLTGRASKTYENRTPSTDHWLSGASGTSGIHYSFHFLKDRVRVELSLDRSSQAENKFLFDNLVKCREKIDSAFGKNLLWRRLDQRKSSKIQSETLLDMTDRKNWADAHLWMNAQMNNLMKVFHPELQPILTSPGFLEAGSILDEQDETKI